MIKDNKINYIIHLAAILSGIQRMSDDLLAVGEQKPDVCRFVNNIGLENTLDLARKYNCQ